MRRVVLSESEIDFASEMKLLRESVGEEIGALASFIGAVRGGEVTLLELEHHPRMTQESIERIVSDADGKWRLLGVTIVHRIGAMRPGEDIVLVLVASAHRKDAFAACEFLMDYLKTEAVLWKLEHRGEKTHWVESTREDYRRAGRWRACENS